MDPLFALIEWGLISFVFGLFSVICLLASPRHRLTLHSWCRFLPASCFGAFLGLSGFLLLIKPLIKFALNGNVIYWLGLVIAAAVSAICGFTSVNYRRKKQSAGNDKE